MAGETVKTEAICLDIRPWSRTIHVVSWLTPMGKVATVVKGAMPPELRKAHAANDAAVLKAYGWPTDLSEPEIVSRLFDMYAKLTSGA